MVNTVVEILRRKDLTDIETVLVVVSMRQAGMLPREEVMPVLLTLLEERTLGAIRGAKALFNDQDFWI